MMLINQKDKSFLILKNKETWNTDDLYDALKVNCMPINEVQEHKAHH